MFAALLTPYTESVLTTGVIFAIASVGLYITLLSGQFSVAHAALLGLGAYTAGVLAVELGWGLWPTVLVATLVGGASGAVIALLVRRMGGMLLGIATLALGQALSLTIANIDYLGGASGYSGVPLNTGLFAAVGVLVFVLAGLSYLKRTRYGLAVLAVGRDDVVAEAIGISVFRTRLWAFAVGGAIAAAAGALLVQFVGLVQPTQLAFPAEVLLFVYVIVGGVSTPWGAVLGAVGFTYLLETLRFSTLDRYWVLGLILVAVVILRPEGILVRRNLKLGPRERKWWKPQLAALGRRQAAPEVRR